MIQYNILSNMLNTLLFKKKALNRFLSSERFSLENLVCLVTDFTHSFPLLKNIDNFGKNVYYKPEVPIHIWFTVSSL